MTCTATVKRLTTSDTLLLATHNLGKYAQFCSLLAPFGVAVANARTHPFPEPEETGETFEENAHIKACAAAYATGLPALADDSGLCVMALRGQPGIHSARWGGPSRDYKEAMARIEKALCAQNARTEEERRASLVTVLCFAWPSGEVAFFKGCLEGTIVWPPRGTQGFGYDPIFQPLISFGNLSSPASQRTLGEISQEERHGLRAEGNSSQRSLSHRAQAFEAFADSCLPLHP